MELMDIVVILLVGIGIGLGTIVVYAWILYQRIKGRVDDMVKQIIQQAEDELVGLDIEVSNGVYFCYDNKDKQFICQGTTVAEIRRAFESRYPGKTAYLAGGDDTAVAKLKESLRLEVAKE